MDIGFTQGNPFKPFEQLMGVFPASRYEIPLMLLVMHAGSLTLSFAVGLTSRQPSMIS